MTTYTHRYTTPTEYQVVEHHDNGFSRVVDPHNEADWITQGNVPAKESGGRFILIIDGVPTLDPNKDAILAAESVAVKAQEDKAKAIVDAKAKVGTLASDVDKTTDIEGLKKVVLDLINQVKIITEV